MGKIIAAALALLLAGGLALQDQLAQAYVLRNSGALEEFALASLEGAPPSNRYGPWDVTVWQASGIVEFSTRRSAAFGGVEKGFYYSRSDTPNSFQATDYPLTEDGGGWRWTDPWGNHGTTEHILLTVLRHPHGTP